MDFWICLCRIPQIIFYMVQINCSCVPGLANRGARNWLCLLDLPASHNSYSKCFHSEEFVTIIIYKLQKSLKCYQYCTFTRWQGGFQCWLTKNVYSAKIKLLLCTSEDWQNSFVKKLQVWLTQCRWNGKCPEFTVAASDFSMWRFFKKNLSSVWWIFRRGLMILYYLPLKTSVVVQPRTL